MILGVGVDIIEIERIKNSINKNPKILNKILTENELEYMKSRNMRTEYIAGRFAAKEAISKAIGTGFTGFGMLDIEVLSEKNGKPKVNLSEKIKSIIPDDQNYKIHLSISHSRSNAIAYAILEI